MFPTTPGSFFSSGTNPVSMTTPFSQQGIGPTPNMQQSPYGQGMMSKPAQPSSSTFPGQMGGAFAAPSQGTYLTGGGLVPTPTTGTFGSASSMGAFPSSSDVATSRNTNQPLVASPLHVIQTIYSAYDLNSPFCKFKHMFYNKVSPEEIFRYQRPSNVEESLWNQAMANNPDPTTMVPVQALGFDDLMKRIRSQEETTQIHITKLKEMEMMVKSLQREHDLRTNVSLDRFKRLNMQQYQRVIKLMTSLDILKTRGVSILPAEDSFRAKLEGIQRELDKPNQHKSRVEEFSDRLQYFKNIGSGRLNNNSQYEVVDSDSLQHLHNFLSEQQKGLAHLIEIIQNGMRELQIIKRGYAESGREPQL